MPHATERSGSSAPVRRGRPRRGQELSREALIDAAIAVIRDEGPNALTTGRLARHVGITQSGFYAHFANLDACLAAVGTRLDEEVRRPIADGMVGLRASDPSDPRELTAYFETLFDLVVERAVLRDLFLPYRGDRSDVGRLLAACEADLVKDLTRHLLAISEPVAAGEGAQATGRAMARMLIAQTFAIIDAWQRGEVDRAAGTRLLAEQTALLGMSAHAAGLIHPGQSRG